MQLVPQSQQGFWHPRSETSGVMQPHVAADAQRDEQGLRVMAVTMMDHQAPCRPAGAASKPVTLKHQLAQAAEPAQRMIAAVLAQAAAAATL